MYSTSFPAWLQLIPFWGTLSKQFQSKRCLVQTTYQKRVRKFTSFHLYFLNFLCQYTNIIQKNFKLSAEWFLTSTKIFKYQYPLDCGRLLWQWIGSIHYDLPIFYTLSLPRCSRTLSSYGFYCRSQIDFLPFNGTPSYTNAFCRWILIAKKIFHSIVSFRKWGDEHNEL